MNFIQYRRCLSAITKILKKKYTNLTAEEAIQLSGEILDTIVIELNIQQE